MARSKKVSDSPTAIDLFCGCGGFGLGFEKCGFHVIAALDSDQHAIDTYKRNRPKKSDTVVMQVDLTQFPPETLAQVIKRDRVDVILGGPPCQGFSAVRQVDGSNSGKRLIHDARRDLYKEYFRYIEFFQPTFFVMENVVGLKTMNGGQWWTNIRNEARSLGYRLCPTEFMASDYGVPQKRRRLLIIGTHKDKGVVFNKSHLKPTHIGKEITLGDAIDDLPELSAGEGKSPAEYDMQLRKKHEEHYKSDYINRVLEIKKSSVLLNHIARPHSDRDLRDFGRLNEGENSYQAMQRGVSFEFPYNKDIFKDRYTRLHRDRPCKTILAHLAKDGLMFIHPTQQRSLTVREAARIQSFPDWFEFPDARTHAFRLIGNAVPPLVARAVAKAIMALIRKEKRKSVRNHQLIPTSTDQAEQQLLAALKSNTIATLTKKQFLQAWYACFYIRPGLHPDEALDHGKDKQQNGKAASTELEALLSSYYVRSGWPEALAGLAEEAWNRYDRGQISEEQFYCLKATRNALSPCKKLNEME